MEQHEHEVHKLINCKDCKEKIEKRAENDHLVSIQVSGTKMNLLNMAGAS